MVATLENKEQKIGLLSAVSTKYSELKKSFAKINDEKEALTNDLAKTKEELDKALNKNRDLTKQLEKRDS